MSGVREPDWAHWLKQWDRQQQNSFPAREERFNSILDVLGARMRRKFTVLDLGCGPGSLSLRGLRRFPKARFIGVDADPVMLKLGRESVGSVGGRMRWVSADIRRSDWVTKLPVRRVDAAISTNALHWLPPPKLRRLYRDIHALLLPRGVFLNGDWLTSKDEGPTSNICSIGSIGSAANGFTSPRCGWTGAAGGGSWNVSPRWRTSSQCEGRSSRGVTLANPISRSRTT